MALRRVTRLWHLFGRATDTEVLVVVVGPSDWAPHEVPQTEPDPDGREALPYLASLGHDPTDEDYRRILGIPTDEELDHVESYDWPFPEDYE